MCILLDHANHKELLSSTNNAVKILEIAVTASKWETRCCINILVVPAQNVRDTKTIVMSYCVTLLEVY